MLAAGLGALLGSRLLAAWEHLPQLLQNFSWIFLLQSKTIMGGLVGGWIGIEVLKKMLKITRSTGDLLVYPLLLAMLIGRMGCALAGVADGTAGLPSHLPWALDQGDGILRHPTAIYEILFLALFWGILAWLQKKYPLKNGDLFKFFMLGYSLWRLGVEALKPVVPYFWGLSAIQCTALLVIIYCVIIFSKRILGNKST